MAEGRPRRHRWANVTPKDLLADDAVGRCGAFQRDVAGMTDRTAVAAFIVVRMGGGGKLNAEKNCDQAHSKQVLQEPG